MGRNGRRHRKSGPTRRGARVATAIIVNARANARAGKAVRFEETGRVTAAAPCELGDELKGALLGPEVGQREAGVRVDDGCQLDAGK